MIVRIKKNYYKLIIRNPCVGVGRMLCILTNPKLNTSVARWNRG